MYKNIIKTSALGCFALFMASCKEQPVGIDLGRIEAKDTSYVTTVEAPQTKNYYVEEFSGVQCTNCPQGAEKLDELSAANPDRLKIVTIHAATFAAPNYNKGSKQDLRAVQGTQIMDLIYGGDPPKPNASFDRLPLASAPRPLLGGYSNWEAMLQSAKTQNATTPINVYVTSTFNTAENAYIIKTKVAYNTAMQGKQNLSLFLIEDNIIDYQIAPLIPDFNFRHVFRQALTPVTGKPILDSLTTKEAGTVFETTYKFVIDLSENNEFKHKFWNLNNVHVVAFVHNEVSATDKKVYQAVDTHL